MFHMSTESLGFQPTVDFKSAATVVFVICVVSFSIFQQWNKRWALAVSSSPNPRKFGDWRPTPFLYPEVAKHPKSDLADIEPLVYHPYKRGIYHVTMGIRAMPWSEWIELDNEFDKYRRIREHRVDHSGDRLIQVLRTPNDENVTTSCPIPAALELVQELAEFLSKRYPSVFQIERVSRKAGSLIKSIHMTYRLPASSESFKHKYELPLEPTLSNARRALEIAVLITQDDFTLMVEGSDGYYYLQAGAVCNAGSWRLVDKMGMRLDQIHVSGGVPQFKERLQLGMERFFRRLPVDKPVVRINYSIQMTPEEPDLTSFDPAEFSWATMNHGSEDTFGSVRFREHQRPEVKSIQNLRLRVERQTLRRMPRSGAIAFGIRVYFTPLYDLLSGVEDNDEEMKRFVSALEGWPEDVAQYKGWAGKENEKLRQILEEAMSKSANLEKERVDLKNISRY